MCYNPRHQTPNPRTTTGTTAAITTAPYPYADIAAVARALWRANDPPQAGPGRRPLPRKYPGLAQNFHSSAWQHLDASDLPQASNKAWGLAAETLKAISSEHSGFIHKHRSITEVAQDLAQLARNAGDAASARQISRGGCGQPAAHQLLRKPAL